ncbi:LCP family protein [Bacillus thermotolerans]|uniref:LCP family protein n=1 Tax=Bacillus thermotolerans TaxID=1221996 RepID=UPI00058322F6|nr:LCP family protein [Bacillus thermotolerans]KKB35934.1 Cell envelope-associated transcriptional attenuator LytR-CpsA-Psr, subfamily F2 [Bacillus thermotolerans]KKB43037.1 Cell envelope-associated transcriptional attenuator LytR-CpsA-Psr, subfamily F2 [Bacillus thermotolerans]
MSASTDRQRMQKKQRKRKKRRLVAFFILLPLVFLAFTAAGYGAFLYNKAETVLTDSYADDGREKSPLRDAEVHPLNDNISILFIGLDESEVREKKDLSRSDALMLVTLNVEEKSIKLLSIPRDSYAYVPAMGYKTKINHAHAYGGPPATIEAVEELMEVPVDYYVRMNFYAFMDVVDALGGIQYDVPFAISEKNSHDIHNAIQLEPGYQKLNGEEALALARTRQYDNDIERGKRQQELLQAVIKKALSFNSITKYDEILEAVGTNMRTNMTFSEMKSLISYGSGGKLDYESLTLVGDNGEMSNGAYIYVLDEVELEVVKRKLQRHLELD